MGKYLEIAISNSAVEIVTLPKEVLDQVKSRYLLGLHTTYVKLPVYTKPGKRLLSFATWNKVVIRVRLVDPLGDSELPDLEIVLRSYR